MARCFWCVPLLLISAGAMGLAQEPARPAQSGQGAADGAQAVFGQSEAPLYGPWRFRTGDSPVDAATGVPLWAEPGFDDSTWEERSLKPEPGLKDPYNGDLRYVRGWTATGHPGYMGYAWYRLRVPAAANDGAELALASPMYVDDGYQVFAHGKLVGGFGKFGDATEPPVVTSTMPATVVLPKAAEESNGASTQAMATQVIAFRVWMGPMGLTHSPYAGGLHYAPYLGTTSAIAARTRLDWQELLAQSAFAPFEGVVLFLLGIVAASLILFDRSDKVYLWVAAVLLFTAVMDAALTTFTLTQVLSLRTYFMFFDVFANPLVLCGWLMVWWTWFRLELPKWMPKLVIALMLLYMVTKAIGGDFFYGADLHPPAAGINAISVVVRLLFLPLLIFIIGLGIRKQGMEGWLVLPAVVPLIISQFASELIVLNLPVKWAPFGITIFVGQVSNLISAAAICVLLLRRLLLSVRRQRQMALDVQQAQEVQQVMVPEARMTLPGIAIESEFRPADQVGGDFFQIIPHTDDGSLLVVVGDVNGKGLRAGMLVALLVGAIRSTSQFDCDPVVMLRALNHRLMGRGFATCMALRIYTDGRAELANAGHLPPYLNGEPLAVEGSLPLGILDGAECSLLRFQVNEGDRLVVMTDGIAEAKNAEGQLLGFEQVRQLLRNAGSIGELVRVAQGFGQQDDISIIALTRTAIPATA
jgi:Stage II sporulation protein E (SpoIIE)